MSMPYPVQGRYFKKQLIGMVALATYCGGPMFIGDLLKLRMETWKAVLITGAPIALMSWGAYTLIDHAYERPSRVSLRIGLLGLVIVLGMDAYALWGMAHGVGTEIAPLYLAGILVGLGWSYAYWRGARRWMPHDDGANHPTSPKPIEPR